MPKSKKSVETGEPVETAPVFRVRLLCGTHYTADHVKHECGDVFECEEDLSLAYPERFEAVK